MGEKVGTPMDEVTSQLPVPFFPMPSHVPALGFGEILLGPNNKIHPDILFFPLN